MKTKTVTIHNWDGSKYDVEAPVEAKYLGILSHTGTIRFYSKNPTEKKDWAGHYSDSEHLIPGAALRFKCPEGNLPCIDGYAPSLGSGELLLKIEEV